MKQHTDSQPRIVVLDGYTLNPGDLSWDKLRALGRCEVYDRTPPGDILSCSRDSDILLTNKVELSREIILALPNLKYIGVTATGVNVVDLPTAAKREIVVTNVPRYATASVAQMVMAHVLNLTQHVASHSDAARKGRWTSAVDWCFWDLALVELAGLTMGIVGWGETGQATARLAEAFGMKVLAASRSKTDVPDNVRLVDLDTLFLESDVVSLHCPLTPETRMLVNRQRLALMKSSALLINTGRGPLVDEAALAEALNSGQLAGAGLDVLAEEPPPADNPLLSAKNCYITPHIAWATQSARSRLLESVIENVAAFLAGQPRNVVA
jgi:glycerate dehydrogenase